MSHCVSHFAGDGQDFGVKKTVRGNNRVRKRGRDSGNSLYYSMLPFKYRNGSDFALFLYAIDVQKRKRTFPK